VRSYDRLVLVLDEPNAALGAAALTLVDLGVDVLYTKDNDEAMLLCRQDTGRICAAVFSVPDDADAAEEIASRLIRVVDCLPAALLPLGIRPPDPVLTRLRELGVEWCLWRSWTDRELRLAAALALHAGNPGDVRKDCRIPVELEGVVGTASDKKQVTVWDLSVGGAYLEADEPFPDGTCVSIQIPLGQVDLEGKGVVSHVKTAGRPGRADRPVGMGIAFTGLSPASELGLAVFLDESLRRFRLGS